jgi:predicted nucleotide-binding protein
MKERFDGADGKRRLAGLLVRQKITSGDIAMAEHLASSCELLELKSSEVFIRENDSGNDVYFLLAGKVRIMVKGRLVNERNPGDHIGEMAAIDPSLPRSATCIADGQCLLAKISEASLAELANKYPDIWRNLAKELAQRLNQRNNLIPAINEKPKIFVICSVEALNIAHEIQSNLQHEYLVTVWTNGVFLASSYPLDALESAIDDSDFGVAIAQPDDIVETRGTAAPAPRDNVVFELGMFMGRLTRARTMLLQPSGREIKLPSDWQGLTAISYKVGKAHELPALLGPACHEIRRVVQKLGVRT